MSGWCGLTIASTRNILRSFPNRVPDEVLVLIESQYYWSGAGAVSEAVAGITQSNRDAGDRVIFYTSNNVSVAMHRLGAAL